MMKPGDIIATPDTYCKLPGIADTAKWMAGSEYHRHQDALLYIGDANPTHPQGYAIAAYPDGAVKIAVPPEEHQEGWAWSDFNLNERQRSAIVAKAISLIGTPHSALDYFAIAAEKLGVPQGDHRAYLADPAHMVGSQLVEHCYAAAGIRLFTDTRIRGYVTMMDVITVIEHPENIDYGR